MFDTLTHWASLHVLMEAVVTLPRGSDVRKRSSPRKAFTALKKDISQDLSVTGNVQCPRCWVLCCWDGTVPWRGTFKSWCQTPEEAAQWGNVPADPEDLSFTFYHHHAAACLKPDPPPQNTHTHTHIRAPSGKTLLPPPPEFNTRQKKIPPGPLNSLTYLSVRWNLPPHSRNLRVDTDSSIDYSEFTFMTAHSSVLCSVL